MADGGCVIASNLTSSELIVIVMTLVFVQGRQVRDILHIERHSIIVD